MLSAVTDYSFPYQNNDHASLTARHKNSVNISPLGQCFHVWTLLRCTVRVCSSARPRQYDRYDVRDNIIQWHCIFYTRGHERVKPWSQI